MPGLAAMRKTPEAELLRRQIHLAAAAVEFVRGEVQRERPEVAVRSGADLSAHERVPAGHQFSDPEGLGYDRPRPDSTPARRLLPGLWPSASRPASSVRGH